MTAPDFTVYDLDGNPVSLSDYFGKPIVLNFWASWCGPCKMELPDFQETYDELGGDVQFLIVNLTDGSRETVETASAYLKEQGLLRHPTQRRRSLWRQCHPMYLFYRRTGPGRGPFLRRHRRPDA